MADGQSAREDASAAALVERLAAWIAGRRPLLFASLAPGASADALAHVSGVIGADLPRAFRELYAWRDGELELYGLQGPWVWMPLERALGERSTQQSLAASGELSAAAWPDGALPFLDDGAGNFVCLDLRGDSNRSAGEVLRYDHEAGTSLRLHSSFAGWLETLCEALESGLYPLVDDDGDASREPTDEAALQLLHAKLNPGYPRG